MPRQPFPPGFLWGAATAAHAVEGGCAVSDWWIWEQTSGRVADDDSSRAGAGWWERADDDFLTAARLGLTALRFSVEWSRVEPDEGRFDDEALARYAAWAERLRGLGLEPVVCLLHGTLPAWLAAQGGLAGRDLPARFLRYADRVVASLADRVRWWLTIDDPVGLVRRGLVVGEAPPGHRNLVEARIAARQLAQVHASVYAVIHRRQPGALVSAGIRVVPEGPVDPGSWLGRSGAWLRDWLGNRAWLESTLGGHLLPPLGAYERLGDGRCSHDFIGVQAEGPALASVALELSRHGRPLLVTSHRLEGEDPGSLLDTLDGLHRALRAGADLRGYLHWSLVDGFEWAEGYRRHTGLLRLEPGSDTRTPTPRAVALADVARDNALGER